MLNILSIPDVTKHVDLKYQGNDHKSNLLSVLYEFRDWLKTPESRELTVQLTGGHPNRFLLTSGLCSNIGKLNFYESSKSIIFNGTYYINLQSMFDKWPHFSGSYSYPVPYSRTMFDRKLAAHAYESYRHNHSLNMYDENDEYGSLRLHLLDFIIGCIERNFKAFVHVDKWREV